MLTQSQGELVEAFQLGHKGADCVPGLLLQSQVSWVLDGLWAEDTGTSADVSLQKGFKKKKKKLPSHLLASLFLIAMFHFSNIFHLSTLSASLEWFQFGTHAGFRLR